ncbi:MAG: VanZ family protein [Bdellovibrionales bacterium]|nr:VanZ family protein [Bdellovibrionales bacterium]
MREEAALDNSPPAGKNSANLLRIYARRGLAVTLVLILIALFGGNYLRREHPYLIALILPAAAIAAGALAYALFKQLNSLPKQERSRRIAMFLLVLLLAAVVCEYSIVAAIERIHFVKYSALALFIFHTIYRPGSRLGSTVLLTLTFSVSIGVSEECTQFFLPGRVFDLRDLFLNASACLIGTLLAVTTSTPAQANLSAEQTFG